MTRNEEVLTDLRNEQLEQREAQRMHANREELASRIAQIIRKDGVLQPLKGLYLSRVSVPLKRVHSVVEPSVALIAQGSKEVLLGESRYRYDPSRYLLTTVDLPSIRGAALPRCAPGTPSHSR